MTGQELENALRGIVAEEDRGFMPRHPAYGHWCAALAALHPTGKTPSHDKSMFFARQLHTQHGVPAEQIIAVASLTIGTPRNPER
jgi:hypothetical protein